jgi:hypothetical protein
MRSAASSTSPQGTPMEDTGLATATYWVTLLETIADVAFAIVIIALAVELVSGRIAKRFERQIVAAQELKIAELNNETARLRKEVGPRQIDADAFVKALEGRPKAPVEIMFPREDGEAFQLAMQFRDTLRRADWTATEPMPVPINDIPRLANQPSHIAAGGQALGVAVVVRAATQDDFKRLDDHDAPTPVNAVTKAILQALGTVSRYAAGPDVFHPPPPGAIRIVVGSKP